MSTLTFLSSTAPAATSSILTAPVTLLTTAATASTDTSAYTSPTFVSVDGDSGYCPKSHSLAEAAGVGISVGAFVAVIVILAFILIPRRQTRARRMSPTIAPDVLVRGPMVDHAGEWEEYREEPKEITRGESLKHKEPPMYATGV